MSSPPEVLIVRVSLAGSALVIAMVNAALVIVTEPALPERLMTSDPDRAVDGDRVDRAVAGASRRRGRR